MINKRLINYVPEAKGHIAKSVGLQIIGLLANIVFTFTLCTLLYNLITQDIKQISYLESIILLLCSVIVKVIASYVSQMQNYEASKQVKIIIRTAIFDKVMRLNTLYNKHISTGELTQLSIEGVEQLEVYFQNYLPQFFYSMIAPLILFVVFSTISIKVAIILFICVPLIPISIIVIQKIAKQLLGKYWGEYAGLADNFLENIQGLNTLKIYSSEHYKHKQMNEQAERFRVVTMKVLSMQLNSIIVMDVVAYGGAALGIIFSTLELTSGNITVIECMAMILLCAEFFLPLRLLGSFFHIAMNGMAASKKIFKLLDSEEIIQGNTTINGLDIKMQHVVHSYDQEKIVLNNISLEIKEKEFISLVGKSGCGKSTIAAMLSKNLMYEQGSISIGGIELNDIADVELRKYVTLVSCNSYIFKGSVKENLLMANPNANDILLWETLKRVQLDEFLVNENGLDTQLNEKGSNFSGGQCQRLAIARALLHDTPIYIFDEATSNIDVESENKIMEIILELTKEKSVIMISHRLANAVHSNRIYVMNDGKIVEEGTHHSLIENKSYYEQLYTTQQELEVA